MMTTIRVFLGGGTKLLRGDDKEQGYRKRVIDPIISELNSLEHAKCVYIVKDYTDLHREVVKTSNQDEYNKYIKKSNIALFIIDGDLGLITREEIDIAVSQTKKYGHPLVYIYGKNIDDKKELMEYLTQEGIYYQRYYKDEDLITKIHKDLTSSVEKIRKKRFAKIKCSIFSSIVLTIGLIMTVNHFINKEDKIIDKCSAQLYLMRYKDVNSLSDCNIFSDTLLQSFKYEDSVLNNNDRKVFPIYDTNNIINVTPPFFRIKLHNKHRNTIVFIQATLEINEYKKDSISTIQSNNINIDSCLSDIDAIVINENTKEYSLTSFRQNLTYGETDDRYFFMLKAMENCSFRMRVKIKSQTGEYLFSNYIYLKYISGNLVIAE